MAVAFLPSSLRHQWVSCSNIMKHILTVDDNALDCILIYTYLVRLGFLVTVCHTVMDAINSIGVHKVDVLVVDLAMPEISGFELISFIREKDKELPIIVISAYAEEFEKQKAFQLGATYYITKPYTKEDVKLDLTQYL